MATSPVQVALPIVLTAAERATLERWARILLQAVAGLSNAASARALRTDRECVGRRRARFAAERLPGLQHEGARGPRNLLRTSGTEHQRVTNVPCRWDARPLTGLATCPREGGMDRLTLTLLGTLLAFLSALCLDSKGLQGVRR
jgi:hypothetical protein